MLPLLLLAQLVANDAPGMDGFLWLECEQFADLGGWVQDVQFIEQMGSSYLLAQGLAGPVTDAATTVELPETGIWHLWARTKNWCAEAQPGPGRFQVLLDGKPGTVCGAAAASWAWDYAGAFRHDAGQATLSLHDLTGQYSRCDAVLLTLDGQFKPPSDLPGYRALRHQLTGVNGNFSTSGTYDVVVVGGGVAGTVAAVSAARHGAKTVLIQDRGVLGGNASTEITVGVAGASANRTPYAREGGLIEEAHREARRLGNWSLSLGWLADQEPNLTVMLNCRAMDAATEGSRITAVKVRQVLTGQGYLVNGRYFIDTTGDGCVGFAAGADYRHGREAKSEFKETLAPDEPDAVTLGTSLLFNTRKMDHPTKFEAPSWAYRFASCDDLPYRNHSNVGGGYWWIEWGGEVDTIADAELIRDNLLRILYGMWDHLKNHCKYSDKAANLDLNWVGYVGGKRESRRLLGDHILTQNEVESAELFRDRVAYGGWPIDLHAPKGIFDPIPPCIQVPVPLYSIPYRSLYSRNIDNLFMAGRDISVSHVALGTTRVMATCGTQGQAVGTAAAMCAETGQTARELGQTNIAELQRLLLRDDANILDLPLQESDNLAQQAQVTASTDIPSRPFGRDAIRPAEIHPCGGHDRAVMLPAAGRVDRAVALLENDTEVPVTVTMKLRGATNSGGFKPFRDLAVARAEIAPGRHWVSFKFETMVDTPYAWFVIPATPGLWWYLTSTAPDGSARSYSQPLAENWADTGGVYALYTEPSAAYTTGCAAAAVVDGYSRPAGIAYHGWMSDPEQKLPQWLQLTWEKPVTIARVELVFDTNLGPRRPSRLVEKECVTDFRLEAKVGDEWQLLKQVDGNYGRRRVESFEAVSTTALRLVVEATGGDGSARVFELRAYER